jgi:hypothetical protein
MAKDEGLCTGNNSRWYFDSQAEACLQFSYSGCRGNRNNFQSREECERICQKYKGMCMNGTVNDMAMTHVNDYLCLVIW